MPKGKPKKSALSVEEESPRYFLNPESVSRHLYCSICQEVFSEPQRAPCGHSYCKKCISQWLKSSKTCPEDRKPILPSSLHHDFILENIIGDQMVACPYRYSGCEFVAQLERLTSHKKSCEFNPVNLPGFLRERNESATGTPDKVMTEPTTSEDISSPAKPSLMMRLYRSGNDQKRLLKSMFEAKENMAQSADSEIVVLD
ncbi:hypothetical protein LOTGIDRAFT_171720 [Lottia gigantea]|uniref:RING-type domain-containing protein n=1 Tax=Lottia gigantea TaxID=225164 RepID=V4B6F7_LOTGI|nr:hypothetical protein LOTGIDRAFT_171720 [Lottia gigantea]ESP03116.1 hypothetical protein LOTGIDRAFT_171720 [Lottia gigantea]